MPERASADDSLRLGRLLAGTLGIEAIVEDIAPTLQGAGCYERQAEAIRMVFPDYQDGEVSRSSCRRSWRAIG